MRMASVHWFWFWFAVLFWWVSATATAIEASSDDGGKREGSAVVRLTLDNYHRETTTTTTTVATTSDAVRAHTGNNNRVVLFVKFFAPWCGHCKKIAGDWERLAEMHNTLDRDGDAGGGGAVLLVAEVDCTDAGAGGGKELCRKFGIQSFPTLRYGDPTEPTRSFEDYNGKRSFSRLSAFCQNVLVPMLGAGNAGHDRDATQDYDSLSIDELGAAIRSHEQRLETAERDFRRQVERLTKEYNAAEETKQAAIKRVVSDGELEIARQTLAMLRKQEETKNRLPATDDNKGGHSDEL